MATNISRRRFLQTAMLATAGAAIPGAMLSRAMAQTMTSPRNSGIYRFKLGGFELISLSDGQLSVPAAVFAGNATAEQVSAVLQAGFQSDTLTPDCNVLYVNTGQNKVLIDSGSGSLNGETVGKLLENLTLAGIEPTEIDSIIITHAHSDHIGGLTTATGALAFPNARYYISKAEWDFWMARNVSLPLISLPDEVKQGFIQVAQQQLGAIRRRVTRFDFDKDILPGLYAMPTVGHTAGHIAVRITSGDAVMVHTADVVHTHTVNLWNPSWQPIFDADPAKAAETRQAVLAKIAQDRTLMYAYHFPFPGIGHLSARSGGGFAWEPVQWQF
jgi:glyoxylase-like metal-dependent hydrolase (beta-lactamase superfamily II)